MSFSSRGVGDIPRPPHTHTLPRTNPLTLSRYDFVPPVKYNYLDADEAEERFEKRNKTLNYFSIMLSKKLKASVEGEEGGAGGSGEGGKDIKVKERKKAADSGLVCCIEVSPW